MLSVRRATGGADLHRLGVVISIHALREEGDAGVFSQIVDLGVFLSTPSVRRATRSCSPGWSAVSYFYPRPPRGGRLFQCRSLIAGHKISIHALREEGDLAGQVVLLDQVGFLSTPSARRATSRCAAAHLCDVDFYPRPPRGGRQAERRNPRPLPGISIHALREEGDLLPLAWWITPLYFYPRPP